MQTTGNEKYYDYFLVSKEESASAYKLYQDTIEAKRKQVQQELLDQSGAIAWREQSSWGEAKRICDLVYPIDSEAAKASHIKVNDANAWFDGARVKCVRGKMNSKAGKKFNEPIDVANKKLEDLPSFNDWLIHRHYKVKSTGIGAPHPGGSGFCMLSTAGGFCGKGEQLVFKVPSSETEGHGKCEIPSCFEQISYGQFYDLVEQTK